MSKRNRRGFGSPWRSFLPGFKHLAASIPFVLLSTLSPDARAAEAAPSPLTLTSEKVKGVFSTRPDQPWTVSSENQSHFRTLSSTGAACWDLRPFSTIQVQVLREKAASQVVRLRWAITSRVGGLYLSSTAAVVPSAGAATVSVAVAANSSDLLPSGHQRPWDFLSASEVIRIELRAELTFAAGSETGPVAIQLSKPELTALAAAQTVSAEVLDVALHAVPAGYRAKSMLTFRIEPPPGDPFSPEGDGDVRVVLPGGKQSLAFVDQAYTSVEDGSGFRELATGRPFWRAYLPEMPVSVQLEIVSGERRWKVTVSAERSAELPRTPDRPQEALDLAPQGAGASRWTAPLEVFFPETREACRGLPGPSKLGSDGQWLAAGGGITPETQATLWRPVPFWNANWGEFGGALRPNMVLARRMDQVLMQAARSGKKQPLIILDGEALDRQGAFNWTSHPLNGALSGPGETYRSAPGVDFLRRNMRYCMARWGLCEAVTELWMTPLLNAPGCSDFYTKTAPLLSRWTKPLGIPLYALHPLARAPRESKRVTSFEPGEKSAWRAENTSRNVYTGVRSLNGSHGADFLEIRAVDAKATTLGVIDNYLSSITDWKAPIDNFGAADALFFDLWVPPQAPTDLRVGLHVRDRDGCWFEALLHGMPNPGDWRTFALDLTAANAQGLKGVNHAKTWTGYSRQRLVEIGIHLYSTHPNWNPTGREIIPLEARLDHIRGVTFSAVEQTPVTLTLLEPNAPENAVADKKELARGELWERHVAVSKTFSNPFDAAECDLAALITAPSGKQVRVPAFFNQHCARREATPGGDEIVEPQGAEYFTVRHRAVESGIHRVTFELRETGSYEVTESKKQPDDRFTAQGKAQEPSNRGNWGRTYYERQEGGWRPVEKIRFKPGTVTATLTLPEAFVVSEAPSKERKPFRGFVKMAADKRHFQFEDGTFFYPIGPCLRSPSDTRIPYIDRKFAPELIDRYARRGTYQYDSYFEAFEKAGINWARVWMCSWWGGLEWRRDWPGYQGIGRYNLLNAWRMDYLLEQCERRGITMDLCLTNHGQFSLNVDTEWRNNPYSARLGGPLVAASEFFTRADMKKVHQNKLRYCVARFGHSPAIMAWSLFSELEWTEEYERSFKFGGEEEDLAAPNIESWHTEMAEFIRAIDPNKHLITTHYSHPTRGAGTLSLPAIDFATSNAYSAFEEFRRQGQQFNAAYALSAFWSGIPNTTMKGFNIYDKPALVEEQGRHWGGGRQNSKEALEADMHCGLWGSVVQPLAGATGYWWWLHLHYDERYGDYKALAQYVAGEDFRPAEGESSFEPVVRALESPDGNLIGRAMKSDRRMYLWIYHQRMPYGDRVPDSEGGSLKIGALKPGAYTIEFWDTYAGTVIERKDVIVEMVDGKATPIQMGLPVVKRDMAVKVKPKAKE